MVFVSFFTYFSQRGKAAYGAQKGSAYISDTSSKREIGLPPFFTSIFLSQCYVQHTRHLPMHVITNG